MKKQFSILEAIAVGLGALGAGLVTGVITGAVVASKKKCSFGGGHIYHIDTTIRPIGSVDKLPESKKYKKSGSKSTCKCDTENK